MKEQIELVHDLLEKDKFTMIVLDACRFDYFKEFSDLDGELEPVHSPAGHTYVWLKRTFRDTHDCKVISQQPLLNSKGVTPDVAIPTVNNETFGDEKWIASDHFDNIYDFWEQEEAGNYSEVTATNDMNEKIQLERPPPKETAEKINQTQLTDRNIIWIMHPHGPYICNHNELITPRGDFTPDRLRHCYRNSMKLIVDAVKDLDLPDHKVVLTADHGECFDKPSEHNINVNKEILGHEPGIDIDSIRKVPWLVFE